ncbi:MAG TPA: hypothetical protein VFV58_35290 [Blastocatellia bacterium]|jgi:hypothetical protein|nr:hypothetical protein [Blastocatellia bacterium]
MKLKKRKIVISVAALLFFILAMAFPFGPLLPWSPVKPGYHAVSYASADIYIGGGDNQVGDYGDVDRMMRDAEAFHQMKYLRRVEVIACKSWGDCERALPWLHVKALGGVTLATGDVIYITPRLKEKNFSAAEFLRHELSHALLSQRTTIRKSLKMTEQAWFSEGLAVSFGDQNAYLSQAEFLERASKTDLAKFIDPELMNHSAPDWDQRFAYPAQRYFLEYLKQRFGMDRFQDFTVKYIDNPDDYRNLFNETFQLSFADAIKQFAQAIKTGQWPAAAK